MCVCVFTRENFDVRLFVAVVCGTTHRVNASVMFDRRGTDEGPVSGYQFIFMYTLALLWGQLTSWLADGDKTDAISHAAGVGTAPITVTLKGWRKKRIYSINIWYILVATKRLYIFEEVKMGTNIIKQKCHMGVKHSIFNVCSILEKNQQRALLCLWISDTNINVPVYSFRWYALYLLHLRLRHIFALLFWKKNFS